MVQTDYTRKHVYGKLPIRDRSATFLPTCPTCSAGKQSLPAFASIEKKIPILKDRKLIIDKLHPYMLIEKELEAQRQLAEGFEPKKTPTTAGPFQDFAPQNQTLLRG